MWDMSAPGSDSEDCFLRIPQTEYFFDELVKPDPLDKMPNVCSQLGRHFGNFTAFSDYPPSLGTWQQRNSSLARNLVGRLRRSLSTSPSISTTCLPSSLTWAGTSSVDLSSIYTKFWKVGPRFSLAEAIWNLDPMG